MQVGDKAVKVKHDIVMKPESAKKQSGFFKSNKSRFPMYPCHEDKIKYDDYGEIIRPEDFMMDTAEPVSLDFCLKVQQIMMIIFYHATLLIHDYKKNGQLMSIYFVRLGHVSSS